MPTDNYIKIRPEERPIRSKIYELMPNSCTEKIRIHPVRSDSVGLWDSEGGDGYSIDIRRSHASLISFDTRQIWECYYYNLGEIGWVCVRQNVYMRLSLRTFEKIFGEIKVYDPHRKDFEGRESKIQKGDTTDD